MTKRDFFRVIIKLFGFYSLMSVVFNTFPTYIYYLTAELELWVFTSLILLAGVIFMIYYFLLANPDLLINSLKLDKGFDDDNIVIGNFDSNKIISFALILLGGLLVIEYLPSFVYNCYNSFKENVQSNASVLDQFTVLDTSYFDWIISTINVIAGLLIMTNYKNIARWFNRVNNKNLKQNHTEEF